MREAMLYQKLDDNAVRCMLCAHHCLIHPGKTGICGVRENREGVLYTLVYGKTISAAVDPIEKKPLYHFYPGAMAFSIATVGCNFSCRFCQNADISQAPRDHPRALSEDGWGWDRDLAPEQVVRMAQRERCQTIAYTYTEPTIFFEYANDCAVLASQAGIKNIFVSNGYMTAEALDTIGDNLHAANIDLKGSDAFYRSLCGARQQPVLDSIAKMRQMGVWVEVTTLVVPGHNDDEETLRAIAEFLASVDPDMPWHVSRFIPCYKLLDAPPTPESTLHRAVEIGYAAGLRYVYAGNVPGSPYEHTRCPECGQICIHRHGYAIRNLMKGKKCPTCGYELAVIL
ncbi:MAG: AmmeMemoRadiSam system radical SAM enzyme [Anaerolineae bacterium]|nr:AmmeMemoRadiSam system radical SAM enzyme [Anaerolineae bacterium]